MTQGGLAGRQAGNLVLLTAVGPLLASLLSLETVMLQLLCTAVVLAAAYLEAG